MRIEEQTAIDQASLWNGPAGRAWVEEQELLDRLFQPIADRLAQAARLTGARRVLDVGCGTGSTTLGAARQVGSEGRCVGIDISEPMIAEARKHARRQGLPAEFVMADAQSHAFEPGGFDMIISRFGVMFFDDPVAAFANLRSATRTGGALRFFAWRGPAENPFMTTAERAAAPHLPGLPPRAPDAPGQFAFADPQRIRRILEESGWKKADIRPFDFASSFPESRLVHYFTKLGPLGLVLADADAESQARIVGAVRTAFDPFVHGPDVRFDCACWEVSASRG